MMRGEYQKDPAKWPKQAHSGLDPVKIAAITEDLNKQTTLSVARSNGTLPVRKSRNTLAAERTPRSSRPVAHGGEDDSDGMIISSSRSSMMTGRDSLTSSRIGDGMSTSRSSAYDAMSSSRSNMDAAGHTGRPHHRSSHGHSSSSSLHTLREDDESDLTPSSTSRRVGGGIKDPLDIVRQKGAYTRDVAVLNFEQPEMMMKHRAARAQAYVTKMKNDIVPRPHSTAFRPAASLDIDRAKTLSKEEVELEVKAIEIKKGVARLEDELRKVSKEMSKLRVRGGSSKKLTSSASSILSGSAGGASSSS